MMLDKFLRNTVLAAGQPAHDNNIMTHLHLHITSKKTTTGPQKKNVCVLFFTKHKDLMRPFIFHLLAYQSHSFVSAL